MQPFRQFFLFCIAVCGEVAQQLRFAISIPARIQRGERGNLHIKVAYSSGSFAQAIELLSDNPIPAAAVA